MEELTQLIQITLAISVGFVWVFRFHNVITEFKKFGLSDLTRNFVGASKISLATLIVVGVWHPSLVFIPSILMGLFMIAAQYFHFKAKSIFIKHLPSLILLILCAFLAIGSIQQSNMDIHKICILVSSLSFFLYCIYYFKSPKMKSEFKRFGLEKFGLIIIISQFLGATGLIVGLKFNPLLTISSLGLAVLMLSGFIVRIKLKDSFWISLPALFYMGLNTYIFLASIN